VEIASTSAKILGMKTFSPDGRFLYYAAHEKESPGNKAVYRVPTMGGPSTRILDGVECPVSFSPDGEQMAFYRADPSSRQSSLAVADKDGRDERILLMREGPVLAGTPAWSPDGTSIAFSEANLEDSRFTGNVRIYSIDVSNGKVQGLSNENWQTVFRTGWTSDGHGLIIIGTRENEAYSTRRDQVYYISASSGASQRITTDGDRYDPGTLGVTKDDAVIAITMNRSTQIWSMDPGGDSRSAFQISRGHSDGRSGLAPLPDGRLGYITRAGDDLDAWVMNADGSGSRQLTSEPRVVEELRSDPKGRFFVFSSGVDKHNHLFRIGTDGGEPVQLTFGDGHEIDSAISPDGKWVVYGSTVFNNSQAETRLLRSPIDGGEPSPFGDNECTRPNFSPDGTLLSCMSERDNEIMMLSADDGAQVARFTVPIYANVNFGARWTPTGDGLVYILSDKDSSNLWVQPLKGGPHRLTDFIGGVIYNFAFSLDGTRLYLSRGYPTQDAVLIRNLH